MAFIIALLATVIEHTVVGEVLEEKTYQFLQRQLHPGEYARKVTVIDSGRVPVDPIKKVTSRDYLTGLLNVLADEHPKAIGIDIDFSPDHGSYVDSADGDFFASLLRLHKDKGVPIYVGVFRTRDQPACNWLGVSDFSELGATLLVPNDAKNYVRNVGSKHAPSMSVALARHLNLPERSWIVKLFFESAEKDLQTERSLIDYSALDSLSDRAIPGDLTPSEYSKFQPQLEDHLILIGDVTHPEDVFPNPIDSSKPIPGALVQAASIYTALNAPLGEPRTWFKFSADFLLASIGGDFLALATLFLGDVEKWEPIVSWITAFAVLAFGCLIAFHRILWDDFLLIAAMFFLHPWLHDHIQDYGTKFYAWSKTRLDETAA